MNMNVKQTEKYIRDEIRSIGLVFKKSKYNNLYVLSDRETKEVVISNITLSNALNNTCSGYYSCYDQESKGFNKSKLIEQGLVSIE